ncbi:MAG: transcription factor E [Candidatus Asgardarchaeia archaeon]
MSAQAGKAAKTLSNLDIKRLKSLAKSLAGDLGEKVIDILLEKRELSDDEISQIIGIRVNDVRRILYRLYEYGILMYRRARDPETNWFIYYWRLNPAGFLDSLRRRHERLVKLLKERLNYEENNMFYICKNKCSILTFDEAIENSFKCPVCGGPLEFYDNSLIKEILKKKISEIENKPLQTTI